MAEPDLASEIQAPPQVDHGPKLVVTNTLEQLRELLECPDREIWVRLSLGDEDETGFRSVELLYFYADEQPELAGDEDGDA